MYHECNRTAAIVVHHGWPPNCRSICSEGGQNAMDGVVAGTTEGRITVDRMSRSFVGVRMPAPSLQSK